MVTFILYLILAVVLFLSTEVVKKFCPNFYKKIGDFIPLIIGGFGIIGAFVISLIIGKTFTFGTVVRIVIYGLLVAASEVFTYDAVIKLVKKIYSNFKPAVTTSVDDIKDAVKTSKSKK
jgi:Na+-translocating ferredoxin:NAD+ oxidoreductase RnfA subunit